MLDLPKERTRPEFPGKQHAGVEMAHIIEFPLREGGSVAVEVQGAGTLGPVTRGGASDTVAKAAHSFEDAISVVEPLAEALSPS